MCVVLGAGACGGREEPAGPGIESSVAPTEEGLIDPAKKRVAESIISTFENSTTKIQYDYAENIEDGRGITAGRAGFTSGTEDLLMVVEEYQRTTQNPDNPLARYMNPLRAVNGTESTKGLDGFIEAWQRTSNTDPALNVAQDTVYNKLYFDPAMERASEIGMRSALGQLAILDTIVQHGEGGDPDGLPAIIAETTAEIGAAANNQAVWLARFLQIRRKHLMNPADPETVDAWRESVSRVDALESMLAVNNFNLDTPMTWTVYGDTFQLR